MGRRWIAVICCGGGGEHSPRERADVASDEVWVGTSINPHRGGTWQAVHVAEETDSDDSLLPVGVGTYTDPALDGHFYAEFFGGEETDGGNSTSGEGDILKTKTDAATLADFWNQIKNTPAKVTEAKNGWNIDSDLVSIAGELKQVHWLRWDMTETILTGSFMTNVRFSVSQDILGRATFANECVLQRVIMTHTATYDDGTGNTSTRYVVEGFGVDAQKRTSVVLDTHAYPHLSAGNMLVDTEGGMKKLLKTEVTVTAAHGWGQYDGMGTAKYTKFYDAQTPYDLTKINFIGDTTAWSAKATVNADGSWSLKDSSAGVDVSGTWKK
jgi:hypothetical protein